MIRSLTEKDIDRVIEIWYESTIKAHDFIPEEMWSAHKDELRHKYLPITETWVAEEDGEIVGFISVLDNFIGALFVKPSWQGQKVGTRLINQIVPIKGSLTVGVYKKNKSARLFYEKHGFVYLDEEVQEETGEIVQNMSRKAMGPSLNYVF